MNTSRSTEEITLEQILANPDTRSEWVKFQLALHKSSTSAIGREAGLTSQAIGMIIRGRFGNKNVEALIAKKIEMPAARIWPERYQYQINSAQARG